MTRLPELDKKGLAAYLEAELSEFSGLQEYRLCRWPVQPDLSADRQQRAFRAAPKAGRTVAEISPCGGSEYRVMRALADSAVPVPEILHLCLDETIIGSVFFVMRFVEGRTFWNPALPELDSASRAACYEQMNAAWPLSIRWMWRLQACLISASQAIILTAR